MSDSIVPHSRKIEISERALSDLEEIWFYYSEVNENTADKVLKQITEKFQKLLEFPKIGKERNELLDRFEKFSDRQIYDFLSGNEFGHRNCPRNLQFEGHRADF